MRPVSRRAALARRLCLSRLPPHFGVGADAPAADMGVLGLRTADLGDRGHDHASQPSATADLVPGRAYHGEPLQRDLGAPAPGAAGPWQLQDGMAASAKAPARDGRPRSKPPARPRRDRRDRNALPLKARSRRPAQRWKKPHGQDFRRWGSRIIGGWAAPSHPARAHHERVAGHPAWFHRSMR